LPAKYFDASSALQIQEPPCISTVRFVTSCGKTAGALEFGNVVNLAPVFAADGQMQRFCLPTRSPRTRPGAARDICGRCSAFFPIQPTPRLVSVFRIQDIATGASTAK
jgi:hypothetical protein